jgi:hypothetical protein
MGVRFAFFDYLQGHVGKTPEKVGKLIQKNSSAGNHLSHKRKKLQQIVDVLYHSGQMERVDRICNSYLAGGHDFLTELYFRNN